MQQHLPNARNQKKIRVTFTTAVVLMHTNFIALCMLQVPLVLTYAHKTIYIYAIYAHQWHQRNGLCWRVL